MTLGPSSTRSTRSSSRPTRRSSRLRWTWPPSRRSSTPFLRCTKPATSSSTTSAWSSPTARCSTRTTRRSAKPATLWGTTSRPGGPSSPRTSSNRLGLEKRLEPSAAEDDRENLSINSFQWLLSSSAEMFSKLLATKSNLFKSTFSLNRFFVDSFFATDVQNLRTDPNFLG